MTIIAFISQKGGVGKSTLAQALATEAKKQKLSVFWLIVIVSKALV